MSGRPPAWRQTGHRIATAIGHGLSRGAGPGSTIYRGDSRCHTTVAGSTTLAAGAGSPARRLRAQSMRRRWLRSSAAATFRCRRQAVTSAQSAGFRWDRARSIAPRTPLAVNISPTLISATRSSTIRRSSTTTTIVAPPPWLPTPCMSIKACPAPLWQYPPPRLFRRSRSPVRPYACRKPR